MGYVKRRSREYLYCVCKSETSISCKVFPFVSTTCRRTNIAATTQADENIVYRTCGPSCSRSRKNNKLTKKFTTCPLQSSIVNKRTHDYNSGNYSYNQGYLVNSCLLVFQLFIRKFYKSYPHRINRWLTYTYGSNHINLGCIMRLAT